MKIKQLGIEIELAVYQKEEPTTCWFLPYTKENPFEVDGHLLHKDASMFELAIAPADEPSKVDANMFDAFNHAVAMLPDGAEMKPVPAVRYSDEALARDPYASVLGCGASQNIYGAPPIANAYGDNYRYGGIHVNLELDGEFDPVQTIFKLDCVLGLNSVAVWEEGYREEMQRRRQYYGRAGEYRVKPFGIEYRTLPNCGIISGMMLWRNIEKALNMDAERWMNLAPRVEEAINTSDRAMAEGLMGEMNVQYI